MNRQQSLKTGRWFPEKIHGRSKSHGVGLIALLICCLAGLESLKADTIDTTSGRGFRGKIEVSMMNANSVTITTSGGTQQKVPSHTIKRITFDGEPTALRSARASLNEGRLNRVEEVLDSVKPQNGIQAVEKEFLIAMANAQLALRGEGGKTIADSRKMLETFVNKANNNKWFQFFQALEAFGDLEVASNNLAAALTQYNKLSFSSSEEIKMLGQFKSGHVNVLLGKFDEAKKAFAGVQANKSDDPGSIRMKLLAKIGAARCSAETGDAKAGIATILDVIKTEDPSDMKLFGNAYNALGHCYVKDGQSKAALLSFLHTDVLYQRDAEIHAEALFQLVKLWQADQKPGQSLEARKVLTTKYRNTFWGNKAQSERL